MGDFQQEISDWLIAEGLSGHSFEQIVSGFCTRLHGAGIPVSRGMVSVRTLHPEVDAHSFVWTPGNELDVADFGMDSDAGGAFAASPLSWLLSRPTETELRRRLTGSDAVVDFDVLHEFRDNGITDYFIQKVAFGLVSDQAQPTGMLCSWASNRPDGFSDGDLAGFRRLAPRLGLSIRNILLREITLNILDTYVGRDAGRRILNGEIRRGSLHEVDAVILFMDLRGFTALSDRLDAGTMAGLLNDYFELMVPPIIERGGEVLKFMGDGILATFSLADIEEAEVCRTGLDAAVDILGRVERSNAARRKQGAPTMDLDIAIHLGRVMYGNVGAANRLDFTVIGSAVNEASRIEALSDGLGRHLVISETFAAAAVHCTGRLVSLGQFGLRGVRKDQELFTV